MAFFINVSESLLFLAYVILPAIESSVIFAVLFKHFPCQITDVSLIIYHLDLVVLIALVYVS
jgi:hypothetical protein